MKILFPYLARWKAINWTRYHSLLSRLSQMGHEVHILQPPAMRSEETNFQEIDVEVGPNLHIEEARVDRTLWNLKVPLNKLMKKGYYAVTISEEVRRIVRERKIDVLLLYNLPHYLLLGVEGCKKVFDFADDYIAMLKQELGGASNRWLLSLGKYMLNRMMERSDMTTCISHVLAEQARGNVSILPNGVDLSKAKVGAGVEIRRSLRPPVVGFIGSFEYFIDFDLILGAARRLPEVTFLLVGGGRQLQTVRDQVASLKLRNVVMPGGVSHDQVFEYIDAIDVCLNTFKKIPISHGACPIKLFEYFGMRKPVVSTRLQEVERIDRRCIFYADTLDETVETLKVVLKDGDMVREYAERGYRMVCEEYNWDRIAKRFLALLEETADRSEVLTPALPKPTAYSHRF